LPPRQDEHAVSIAPHFAELLVRWQKHSGRNHLPWQNTRDPYRVWLSEIMLQQTQVATVLGFYSRFLARFPSVADLAAAEPDEVLGLWSGLGYYSRARNLHRCAKDVVELHQGVFPSTALELQTLPGIGPSTAAAIAAFCFGERAAILDANVKRVLARVLAFEEDLAVVKAERNLWRFAESLLPHAAKAMAAYTQGLMDLGATVCTPKKPRCGDCPVRGLCRALHQGGPEQFPRKTRKLKRSSMELSLLWARRRDGAVWLVRRPAHGIWGGLYCLPVFDNEGQLRSSLAPAASQTGWSLAPFKHVLTHRDLYLKVWVVQLEGSCREAPVRMAEDMAEPSEPGKWVLHAAWQSLGLPAPIRSLLQAEPQQTALDLPPAI
jgi:A/G-specific adenine glycosylase